MKGGTRGNLYISYSRIEFSYTPLFRMAVRPHSYGSRVVSVSVSVPFSTDRHYHGYDFES